MALMILVQVPLGFLMVQAYDAWLASHGDPVRVMALARVHDTIGLLVLTLVVARLAWRAANPTPELPGGITYWQRRLARGTHVALYALLVLFPLTGWAALSAYTGTFPIFFFGWDHVPRLVPKATPGSPFTSDFFTAIHVTCWKIGGPILALHAGAALWHGLAKRDGVLRRMWSGAPTD
jgi:cytochrome b561